MKKILMSHKDITDGNLTGYLLIKGSEKALVYIPRNDADKLSCPALVIVWVDDNKYSYDSSDLGFINFEDVNILTKLSKLVKRLRKICG